jgi:pyrroline-5-carboxylate reductase
MIIGFVGAGHIAHALAEGWSRPELAGRPEVRVHDVDGGKAAALAAACGGTVAAGLTDLVTGSDLVLVAVRPQHVEQVLRELGPALGDRPLVSVAAGVRLERVRAALPPGSRAGRVMPNVASALGLGTSLFVPGTLGETAHSVQALFALFGEVFELDEVFFDAATSVAGCTPGILGRLVQALAAAGVELGLEPEAATRLAISGVHGAAAIIAREGDPAAVVKAAATPGGMTEAAVGALEERELAAAVHAAVAAATARARELA